MPLKEQERSVVKKGKESDEAYTRRVLGPLANCKNLVVINDEAHHAYRKPADIKVSKADAEASALTWTRPPAGWRGWTASTRPGALRAALTCRPRRLPPQAAPTPRRACCWVVSDFGLNDAIEAGLVKRPAWWCDDALPNAQTLRPSSTTCTASPRWPKT
jgi:type III restriction enzyme